MNWNLITNNKILIFLFILSNKVALSTYDLHQTLIRAPMIMKPALTLTNSNHTSVRLAAMQSTIIQMWITTIHLVLVAIFTRDQHPRPLEREIIITHIIILLIIRLQGRTIKICEYRLLIMGLSKDHHCLSNPTTQTLWITMSLIIGKWRTIFWTKKMVFNLT